MKNFIVIEGIDGCGKTTQVKKLKEWLEKEYNVTCTTTAEPSSSSVGKFIREKILSGEEKVNKDTLAKLFVLDREEHLREIEKLIKEGQFVICDRYIRSNIAYQGGGDFEKEKVVANYNKDFPTPLATIYLRIDPTKVEKIFTERVEHRENTAKEIFDQIDTQTTLAKSYDRIFRSWRLGTHNIIVDATQDADEVFDQITKRLKLFLEKPTKKEFTTRDFIKGLCKQIIHYYKDNISVTELNETRVLNNTHLFVENIFYKVGLVTFEKCNNKLLLWALNPTAFTVEGFWKNLSDWVNTEYNMVLAIGRYNPFEPLGTEDISHTPQACINEVMEELWGHVDDKVF